MGNIQRRQMLGEAIRAERTRQHISQRAFARMLGHNSHCYVSQVENGETSIGFDRLCDIADALDVTVAQLVDGM